MRSQPGCVTSLGFEVELVSSRTGFVNRFGDQAMVSVNVNPVFTPENVGIPEGRKEEGFGGEVDCAAVQSWK